jgi:hypothetical protein
MITPSLSLMKKRKIYYQWKGKKGNLQSDLVNMPNKTKGEVKVMR